MGEVDVRGISGAQGLKKGSPETGPSGILGMKPSLVTPGLFGLIHRHICPLDNIVRTGFVMDKQHHADTRRTVMLDGRFCLPLMLNFQHVRLCQSSTDLFSDDTGLCGGLGFVFIQPAEHHHELIPAKTRDGINLTHATGEAFCYFYQQLIAHIMPVLVIERLEIIQIQEHQRTIQAAALAGGHGLFQTVV